MLPENAEERKKCAVYRGFFAYFPDAIAAVATHSVQSNEQHNPGTEPHWDRSKSPDELDAMLRHVLEQEWVAVAWRAMANLQKQIEQGYNCRKSD
jgi:hypothetical protein